LLSLFRFTATNGTARVGFMGPRGSMKKSLREGSTSVSPLAIWVIKLPGETFSSDRLVLKSDSPCEAIFSLLLIDSDEEHIF
jgi:hypothetical protein